MQTGKFESDKIWQIDGEKRTTYNEKLSKKDVNLAG